MVWPKVHFRVMSSTSKITKRDKQMYLMWTVPITHLSQDTPSCNAVYHFLCWDGYIYSLWRPPLKTWIQPLPDPDIKQKKSEGSRVPDYNRGFLVVTWQMFEKWKTNGGIIGFKAKSCCKMECNTTFWG